MTYCAALKIMDMGNDVRQLVDDCVYDDKSYHQHFDLVMTTRWRWQPPTSWLSETVEKVWK